jgi:ADP-heptose:LPS heptosyltransferase
MSSALPQWDGAPAKGKTILLFGEQGAGDMIQFVRYAPMVAERCARTVLVCGPDLKTLLKGVNGVSEVVDYDEQPPRFDQHVPLMSLPKLFKTDLDSIPAPIPYLSADPAKVEHWRLRLGGRPGRKIGLAWAGRITHPNDRNRSMSLAQLAPLAAVKNVQWISLQKGPAEAEARTPQAGLEITDVSSELTDYSDTAALIANLDLVISVDTSVVHVAGAMGKPVWVLLPFIPDWRWLLDRPDSPWYPTMRLFRQRAVGDWEPVVQGIAEKLKQR